MVLRCEREWVEMWGAMSFEVFKDAHRDDVLGAIID